MPKLQITTDSAEKVWSSPDGQRTIYKVVMLWNGKKVAGKTYSKAIASEGFSGEVETYEKEGRNGSETFVKQPPKENPGYGSTGGGSQRSGSGYTPKDEKAIQAMWAIDKAKDLTIAFGDIKKTTPMDELFSTVEAYAQGLFAMVDRVKASDRTESLDGPDVAPEKPDTVVDPDEDNPLDLSKIDEVFGTKEGEEE